MATGISAVGQIPAAVKYLLICCADFGEMGLELILNSTLSVLVLGMELIASLIEILIDSYLVLVLCGLWHLATQKPRLMALSLITSIAYSVAKSQSFIQTLLQILTYPMFLTMKILMRVTMILIRLPFRLVCWILLPRGLMKSCSPHFKMQESIECFGENCSCNGWKVKEFLIGGHHSLSISAEPPAKCIIHFEKDGKHVGFGATAQLQCGLVCIATPFHVYEVADRLCGSKGSMPIENFLVAYNGGQTDMALLVPKKEFYKQWRSALGVKSRKMKPVTQVGMGGYKIFFQNTTGSWFCQPAQIKGLSDCRMFLRTEYNSEPGFSGLPIFNDKSQIVALHRGSNPAANENEASYLLDLPGLSSVNIAGFTESVYEDTAILKGVYTDEDNSLFVWATIRGKKTKVPISASTQKKVAVKTFDNDWYFAEDDDDEFYATAKVYGQENSTKKAECATCLDQETSCQRCLGFKGECFTSSELKKMEETVGKLTLQNAKNLHDIADLRDLIRMKNERIAELEAEFLNGESRRPTGETNGSRGKRAESTFTAGTSVSNTTEIPEANSAPSLTSSTLPTKCPKATPAANVKSEAGEGKEKKPRPALTSEQKKARNLRQRLKRKEKRAARKAEAAKTSKSSAESITPETELRSLQKMMEAFADSFNKRQSKRRSKKTSTTSKPQQGMKQPDQPRKASAGQEGAAPSTMPPNKLNSSPLGGNAGLNLRPGWHASHKGSGNPKKEPQQS